MSFMSNGFNVDGIKHVKTKYCMVVEWQKAAKKSLTLTIGSLKRACYYS